MDRRIEFESVVAGLRLIPVVAGRDWPKVLSAIRARLDELARHPKIAADGRCIEILEEMTTSGDMRHFARQVDELGHRLAWLMRDAGDAALDAVVRRRPALATFERLGGGPREAPEAPDGGRPRPGRTRVRL
mgnify:CR=1 FL=1